MEGADLKIPRGTAEIKIIVLWPGIRFKPSFCRAYRGCT
jgi:hypothetical protein